MNDVAGERFGTWEFQLDCMQMTTDREKYIQALAEQKFARMKVREHVRTALSDETLTTAIKAQAWLEADPSKVSLDADGKLQCPAELPLGCGSDHIKAKIAERLFPNAKDREMFGWAFQAEDEGDG